MMGTVCIPIISALDVGPAMCVCQMKKHMQHIIQVVDNLIDSHLFLKEDFFLFLAEC